MKRTVLYVLLILGLAGNSCAEEMKLNGAVPVGILSRTYKIKYQGECSSFVFDVDDKQYLITAKHCLSNIKDNDNIELYDLNKWKRIKVHPIFCKIKDVDIVALALDIKLTEALKVTIGSPALGKDVYFIGFPLMYASRTSLDGQPVYFPFVKKAVLSGVDAFDKANVVFYLDGHNNPGFSGGPVIYSTYPDNKLAIMGVISGYAANPLPVKAGVFENIETDNQTKQKALYVEENTGLIRVYHIGNIIEAIRENPIGYPLGNN